MSCPICGAVLPFGGLQRRCDRCDMEMMLHAQLAETAEKRIVELERGRCEDCGATLTLDGCVLCGAPVCCPQCCRIQSLVDHIEKLQAAVLEMAAHLRKIHDRAHSWNNIPACSDIEQMAAQALGLRGVAALERERDIFKTHLDLALKEEYRLRAEVAKLETQRVPNPGVVGTLQDKNTLLQYKDAQIARLQARVQELEARTSDKDSASGKAETT